jgi:lipoprotein-releasing system ATP-binding protein
MTLGGRSPFELSPIDVAAFRNTAIGFVFQDHCLLPQCAVLERADSDARQAFRPTASERARRLIEQVGVGDRVDHRPAELSGGERQRVAVKPVRSSGILVSCCATSRRQPRSGISRQRCVVASRSASASAGILIVVTHSAAMADRFPKRFELADRRLVAGGGG